MNKSLGQYYTEDSISRLLVDSLTISKPESILEIGVGEGALLRQVSSRWQEAKITGVEIDLKNKIFLKKSFPKVDLHFVNGISNQLGKEINLGHDTVDLAVCNPPYLTLKKNQDIAEILSDAMLGDIQLYDKVTSDIVILAQNLLFLKEGGKLGIILPDGPVTSHDFTYFRHALLTNHTVEMAIELPDSSFTKTEAKTHILVISKGRKEGSYPTQMFLADAQGKILHELKSKLCDESLRLDYSYNFWLKREGKKGLTLRDFNVEISRGSFSKKFLVDSGFFFLHTTDINCNTHLSLPAFESSLKGMTVKKGDIIMSRVGRNNLGRVAEIDDGEAIISDCVYRIRIAEPARQKFLDKIHSPEGKDWINAHRHGVCAKVISKADLLNFTL